MRLGRRLTSGVDVWLNNPVYPLEASGTSGMKAGMNGVINLSVLDGWWGEGYTGDNGWAIKPTAKAVEEEHRDQEEARTLYEILQDRVVPMYYNRGNMGYSTDWTRMSKRSIATILPRFNASRMVNEYVAKFYLPASQSGRKYAESGYANAKIIAQWKTHVRTAWPNVTLRRIDTLKRRIRFGESIRIEVAFNLDGLAPADVCVEAIVVRGLSDDRRHVYPFVADGTRTEAGEHRFVLELEPELCGRLGYRIRAYPAHELLTHPFELGLMLWA
jgi:starch phosphorylase